MCLKKGERFTQNGYNHRHQHVLKQTHTFEQSIIERINKFLQQEDNKQELHELRAEIEVTYRLPSKEFDQLYSQALTRLKNNSQLYDGKEIDELDKKLKTERYTILGDYQPSKLERENRTITRSMLILNDQMLTNYKKYG